MSDRLPVAPQPFTSRGWVGWLSLAIAASVIDGSYLCAESERFDSQTTPVIAFRPKASMSRQPRPSTAPTRQLDPRASVAVVLLGIETLEDSEQAAASPLPMGEWTPLRFR